MSAPKHPFPRFPQFKNKWTGDLAWAIGSPSLIRTKENHSPSGSINQQNPQLLDDSHFTQYFQDSLDWFLLLDSNPQQINHWMDQAKDRRLGSLYEHLIAFWLHHGPSPFKVIRKSLQVIDNNHTLGEFDFILQSLIDLSFRNIEVAVKFYIGTEPMQSMDDFVGPRVIDRLGRKWRHLVHRQCQLHLEPQAKSLLLKITGSQTVLSSIWIKGRLFIPWTDFLRIPSNENFYINLDAHYEGLVGGWWMSQSEFLKNHNPSSAVILRKLDYFGPLTCDTASSLQNLISVNLKKIIQQNGPLPVALINSDTIEISRGWIVPENWPLSSD